MILWIYFKHLQHRAKNAKYVNSELRRSDWTESRAISASSYFPRQAVFITLNNSQPLTNHRKSLAIVIIKNIVATTKRLNRIKIDQNIAK